LSDAGRASARTPPPITLLLGADPLLVDRRLQQIQAATVGATPAFGCHEVLHGDSADLETLATAVRTLALAGRRLVVLRGADKLREDAQRGLVDLLEQIPKQTTFVLVAPAVDMRRALFAALKKRPGCVEELEPPSAEAFIRKIAAELGLELEPEAVETIAEHVGQDASRIASELTKLELRFGKATVDARQAAESMGGDRVLADFALANALRARDAVAAIVALRESLAQGEEIYMLIGQIAYTLRSLLRAAALLESGLSVDAATRAFGGPGARFAIEAARRYRRSELVRGLFKLGRIDLAAKTGGGNAVALLERLVLSLASGGRRARAGRA
jgi:DNA polymerase-3 subunit delta